MWFLGGGFDSQPGRHGTLQGIRTVGESWSGIGEKEKKNYREKLEEKKRGGEAREVNWFVHSPPHHHPRWGPSFFHQPLAQMHAGRAGNVGIAVVGCLYSPLDVYHSHPLAGGKT